jgi:hypothetical protein
MKPDELGQCVYVLYYKLWGKTLVGNRLKSRAWWEHRRDELINAPTVNIPPDQNINPGIFDTNGNPIPNPVPFEQEMGWTEDISEYWLGWLQIAFLRRYEH